MGFESKYLPDTPTTGVWRCPAVKRVEIDATDKVGWKGNRGGYGVSANIMRTQLATNGTPQAPVRSASLPRPSMLWMVGDVGQPVPYSEPGAGKYRRIGTEFGRPSTLGAWVINTDWPSSQPALRHKGAARWTAFDGHRAADMTWADMLVEKGNFTARGDTF